MNDFPTLLYSSTCGNPYPFIHLKPEKGTPFEQSLPVQAITGSAPPPGGGHLHSWKIILSCYLAMIRIKHSVRILARQQPSFRSFYGISYCLKQMVSIVRNTKVRNHRRVASSPSAKFKYLRK